MRTKFFKKKRKKKRSIFIVHMNSKGDREKNPNSLILYITS